MFDDSGHARALDRALRGGSAARPHRLGPALQEDDRAALVDRPLDVLRTAVVLLGLLRELRRPPAPGRVRATAPRGARPRARRSTTPPVGGSATSSTCLVGDLGLDDLEHHLVDAEAVGRDGAADDGLAEAEARLDRDDAAVAVRRVRASSRPRAMRRGTIRWTTTAISTPSSAMLALARGRRSSGSENRLAQQRFTCRPRPPRR